MVDSKLIIVWLVRKRFRIEKEIPNSSGRTKFKVQSNYGFDTKESKVIKYKAQSVC